MLTEEDYLLVCLAEEATEVGHAVSKCLRFGLGHWWADRDTTNRNALREELRDLFRVAERLNLIDFRDLPDKRDKFERAMQLSRDVGRLEPRS